MTFRLQASRIHLTYKGHLPRQELVDWIGISAGSDIKDYSFVHETSDGDNNYDHTHILVWLANRLCTKNQRVFDFDHDNERVHPHIKTVTTNDQWSNTWKYHEKDPVGDSLFPQPHDDPLKKEKTEKAEKQGILLTEEVMIKIFESDDLGEAVQNLGIRIKSVSDVNLIRNAKKARVGVQAEYDTFNREITKDFRFMIVYGTSGTGKTEFAAAHFKNALFVTHMDDLRHYNPRRHDGIIFDDMSFAHLPRETIIHIMDWTKPRSIHCRYGCALIPANTKKIITTNLEPHMILPAGLYDDGAVSRRISKVIEVRDKLWDDPIDLDNDSPVEDNNLRELNDALWSQETIVDNQVWCNGQLIRDANGKATNAVPPSLRNVGIFANPHLGKPIPSVSKEHLRFD